MSQNQERIHAYLSARERQKYEIAASLGLLEEVRAVGWAGLSAKNTGRIGGMLGQWQKEQSSEAQP